jgi:hypothetical protein
MGRSEGEESERLEDDGQSDDTSSRITKCDPHIDNHICHRSIRVPDALHCDIAGFGALAQEADESRRSYGLKNYGENKSDPG